MVALRPWLALLLVSLGLVAVPLRELRLVVVEEDPCASGGCCCGVESGPSCCEDGPAPGVVIVATCGCSSGGEICFQMPSVDWLLGTGTELPTHAAVPAAASKPALPREGLPEPATPPPRRS